MGKKRARFFMKIVVLLPRQTIKLYNNEHQKTPLAIRT